MDGEQKYVESSRREVFSSLLSVAGGLAFVSAQPIVAQALDMDAFMNSELEADTKNCDPKRDPRCVKEMSKEEALCKFGASGKAKGEACKTFKASGGSMEG